MSTTTTSTDRDAARLRLFFALWPPAAVRQALAGRAAELQARLGGRLMQAATLHLTLLFLGEQPRSRLPFLRQCGAAVAARHAPFTLTLDALGQFPQRPGEALWWAGCTAPPEALWHLQADLVEAWQSLPADLPGPPEKSSSAPWPLFVPHVSLLRNVARPAADNQPASPEAAGWQIPWPVDELHLVCSPISRQAGPHAGLAGAGDHAEDRGVALAGGPYRSLAGWRLAGAEAAK